MWLSHMENHKDRVPTSSFIKYLDDLAKAADLVVRYGCAVIASQVREGAALGRLVQGKLPRPAPARFRGYAAALVKRVPADEYCPPYQFPDRVLANALMRRGTTTDRTLIEL